MEFSSSGLSSCFRCNHLSYFEFEATKPRNGCLRPRPAPNGAPKMGPCSKDHYDIDYGSLISVSPIYDYDHMLYNCLNFLFCIILSHFALTCSWHEPLLRLWLDHITFRQPYHHGQVLLLAKERLEANLSSTLVSGSGQVANNDPQLFRAAGRSCLLKWLNVTRFRVDFNVEYHK